MTKSIVAAATLLAISGLHTTEAAFAQEVVKTDGVELQLPIGEGQLIRLSRPAASVFVADTEIADVHVRSPHLIYVMAKAPGATTLFAIDSSERVIMGRNVVVGFNEERLVRLISQHAPDSRVTVGSINDALVLSGEVPSAATGEEILRIASRFIRADESQRDAWLINKLTVTTPNQVNLRVRIAEVSREAGRSLGFNWSALGNLGDFAIGLATGRPVRNDDGDLIRTPDGGGALFGGFSSSDAQIDVLIDALQSKGLISILSEPNLTARSGEPASFLAGGEYPIPVPQGQDQITIEYKRFGVSLSFVATVVSPDRISLEVRPEVSQLSNAGAITLQGITVPALTTRRAETTVELGNGQSFAIAGLLQNTSSRDVERVPGLGDIPIIGQLFRSTRFQENKSELVIIVTPYLVRPVSRPLITPVELLDWTRGETIGSGTEAMATEGSQEEGG